MAEAILNRQTFTFSRELEFFSEKELTTQIGLPSEYWLSVILKELLDNALDGCETAGVSPSITVSIIGDSICIEDNGNGIAPEVITKILDFTTRTSDKVIYCSPSRGQQGNALKTILAIPYVLTNKTSHLVIESRGVLHDIRVRVDIDKPLIEHNRTEIVKIDGTKITVYTGIELESHKSEFLQIVLDFFRFSPHMSITTHGFYASDLNHHALIPDWQKWTPHEPTSPYWYSLENFRKLITAHIALSRDGGPDLTIREFIKQFRGLSSTQRQKFITDSIPNVRRLSNLVVNDHELDMSTISHLLSLIRQETKPVPPEMLGVIGEAHFQRFFNDPIKYHCIKHKGEVPFVVEAAFGYIECLERPEFSFGLNFSPAFSDPFDNVRLSDGKDKHDWGIHGLARCFELNYNDKVRLIVHVTHPCLTFNDKSKARINPDEELRKAVGLAVAAVLKEHYTLRKKADKQSLAQERHEREVKEAARPKQMSVKDAVFLVMPAAAVKAAGSENLPYSVRQLYYAVRPLIQEYTDKPLEYSYFTPPLVTEYEDTHGMLAGLIYDPRGHLYEPHNNVEIALGTEDVENYEIPEWTYDKILYIEKEGFKPILDSVQLGQRYDMAIMTSKGYAVRAAKQLLARATTKEITILCAHDCDIYGFEIARTLAEETRTSKGLTVKVIDLGLQVADALNMGLESEKLPETKKLPEALTTRLDEIEARFLTTNRIELNAMSTSQLITWLEGSLAKLGLAKKVIPPDDVLAEEISFNLNDGLRERTDTVVKETIESVLGIDFAQLAQEVLDGITKPKTEGHRNDLAVYMDTLPTAPWRSWAENRAQKLESETAKELRTVAETKIKELLKGSVN